MKQRSTTPVSKIGIAKRAVIAACAVMSIAAVPISMTFVKPAYADEYDDRIAQIQKQIDSYQSQANELSAKADSLQAKLDELTAQKNAIQAKINLTQAQHDSLKKKIADNKERISKNKDVLGDTLADIYVDDNISPLEMLAGSDNLGKIMAKNEYRSTIRDNLKRTIDDIKEAQKELEKQEKEVARVLADQENAKEALAQKEQEQAALVAQTRGESSAYASLAESQKAEKLRVQQQQQEAIAARLRRHNNTSSLVGGGSLASYDAWLNVNCYVDSNALSHALDPLGYGCNQCVSYAAYMMKVKTGYGPSYWGNANMWPASARRAGYTPGNTPRANSLGVISAGRYGHIVYIENYNAAAGTVDISQYNEYIPGQGWGKFSRRYNVPASTYDTYIYL